MDNSSEMMSLCRLCLVKDQVNVPIFEEQGDVRQIFFKISSCLPVKVSRDDKLPKKICDGCLYKLDMLYEFWKTSANAEKTLLSWLGQAGVKGTDVHQTLSAVAQEITNKPNDSGGGAFVKEEPNDAAAHQTQEVDPNFMLQNFQQKWGEDNAAAGSSASAAAASSATVEEPPRKRARRTAAVKAQINLTPETDEDDDDDMDNVEPITKVEDESDESDGDDRDDGQFGDVSGTNNDDQPGPSGVGKDGGEIPSRKKRRATRTMPVRKRVSRTKRPIIDEFSVIVKLETDTEDTTNDDKDYVPPKKKKKKSTGSKTKMNNTLNAKRKKRKRPKVDDADRKRSALTYCCKYCHIMFSSALRLGCHIALKHELDQYICVICNEVQSDKKALEDHIERIHEKVEVCKLARTQHCVLCRENFKSKADLADHKLWHETGASFTCVVCEESFRFQRLLLAHQVKKHWVWSEGERVFFKCPACFNKYPSAEKLAQHDVERCRAHKDAKREERHLCQVCGKELANAYNLRVHVMTHTGEKRYACTYCGRKFRVNHERKVHERIHTGERPFTCDFCGKGFRQRNPFKVHLRTHTGEKPYKCKICGRGYTTNQNLRLHLTQGCLEKSSVC